MHSRNACQRAFTLLELLVTVVIAATLAAIVSPMFSDDSRLRVMAASSIVASDIELAQVMTISRPDKPVVVSFDADGATYWLAYASSPGTALTLAGATEPYEVTLGEGRARGAAGVALAIADMTSDRIAFAAHGGLIDFTTTPLVKLTSGERGIQLAVTPATGSIVETDFSTIVMEPGPKDGAAKP